MHSLKNIVGVLGALIGILYCGGLIFYFLGSWGELGAFKSLLGVDNGLTGAKALGLGPTILGLGAIGLVFVVILLIRIALLITRRDPPPRERDSQPGRATADDGGAAADTMIARYMAKRSAEAAAPSQPVAPRPATNRAVSPQRTTFGRRTR
jgi:predicted lipid-binding transport protein (Tim44 family)